MLWGFTLWMGVGTVVSILLCVLINIKFCCEAETQIYSNLNKIEMYFSHIDESLKVSNSGLCGGSFFACSVILANMAPPNGPRCLSFQDVERRKR